MTWCDMIPSDLNGKDGPAIAQELFGWDPDDSEWWSLTRIDEKNLEWKDLRLGISWKVSHGYLVALREVSKPHEASVFAEKNKIQLMASGGFYFRNTAELFIRCVGLPPPEQVVEEKDLYRVKMVDDVEASIGYSSQLFVRLVGSPTSEINNATPDPYSLTTIVLSPVEKEHVEGVAELSLYHLRKKYPSLELSFWPLVDLKSAPALPDQGTLAKPGLIDGLASTRRPETIAFYNRALESPPIPGFLYLYRVLESCFDDVVSSEVSVWRRDPTLSDADLLQKIRRIQQKEDSWSLRRVLRDLVDQKMLDSAFNEGLIEQPDADALTRGIYSRRNSIAHGRKGQHRFVLVPLGHPMGGDAAKERAWYRLIKELADRAMDKWILHNG